MIVLSILIATTPDRNEMFTRLYNELHRQLEFMQSFHTSLGEIEIIVDDSKRFLDGGLSIGKKREALLMRSKGKYSCWLDSDDWISPMYLETLVRLCQHDRDVCTFRNMTKLEAYWMVVDMSIHYPNDQPNPNYTVRRKPWIVCPIRTEFAKLFKFPDSNYSEDSEWLDKVLTRCTTEAKTEQILHEYRHGKHSEADKITQHEKL